MKILFLSGHYPPNAKGGAEISAHLVARGLVALGHEVTVIAEGETSTGAEYEGVRILRRPLTLTSKPLFERRHAKWVARRVKKEFGDFSDFDIVHAHDFRSALVLYELGLSDAVVTARDYAQISGDTNYWLSDGLIPKEPMSFRAAMWSQRVKEAGFPRNMFRVFQYAWNVKYRAEAFRSFAKQIFISEAQKNEIAKHQNFANQKQAVIYNPIAPKYLDTPPRPGKKQVLYIGRVEEYKGVRLLLEAWKQLQTDYTLLIVGRGAQFDEYKQLVEHEGLSSVTFRDHVPYEDIMGLYDESSIVVAPHLWLEPFGRAVVEAMARERIVVAADAGGPGEVIVDERDGILFERGSVEDLTENLTKALELVETKTGIGTSARAWVLNNLTIENIAKQYEAFYRS